MLRVRTLKPDATGLEKRYLQQQHSGDHARLARFSTSQESGRWWNGRPELSQAFIEAEGRTLLLGLSNATLESPGVSASGLLKSSQYHTTTKTFYYDLSDTGHVRGLLHTFRLMAAYAAGLRGRPGAAEYWLPMGVCKELYRHQVGPGQFEALEVECVDGNFRAPDDPRMFAWNRDIRAKVWAEYFRNHKPLRRYIFRLSRVADQTATTRIGRCTEFELPADDADRFVARVGVMLHEFWLYVLTYPEQVTRRYDCSPDTWIRRWQLYHPVTLNTQIAPVLDYVFSAEAEPALFTHPQVYVGDCPRLDARRRFDPLYLSRLRLYAQGKLRWHPNWEVTQDEADQDVAWIREQVQQAKAKALAEAEGRRASALSQDVLLLVPLVRALLHLVPPQLPAPLSFGIYTYCASQDEVVTRHRPTHQQRGPPN